MGGETEDGKVIPMHQPDYLDLKKKTLCNLTNLHNYPPNQPYDDAKYPLQNFLCWGINTKALSNHERKHREWYSSNKLSIPEEYCHKSLEPHLNFMTNCVNGIHIGQQGHPVSVGQGHKVINTDVISK